MNQDVYIVILRRIRDATRRKRSEKWRTNRLFLLHDNAPAHRSGYIKDFLEKNNVKTLEDLPHSPALPTAHFYMFHRKKSALKGRDFCDVTDIIKNATEELKRLSKYDFQECSPYFHSRLQKCIFAQRTYFEGNVVSIVVLCCISVN